MRSEIFWNTFASGAGWALGICTVVYFFIAMIGVASKIHGVAK